MNRQDHLRGLARKIELQTGQLNARASHLIDCAAAGAVMDFDIEMLRDRASGIAHWVAELEKAVRK